jgi:predicted phosphodiesterase
MKKYFICIIYSILLVFLLNSCATYNTQIATQNLNWRKDVYKNKEVNYVVYLVGDAGKVDDYGNNIVTQVIGKKLATETQQSAIIYLGDNIYPNGLPKKNSKKRKKSEEIIDAQLEIVKNFKGKTIFIPGNHDWRKDAKGIERQQKYIEKKLDAKNVFFPKNGCALQKIKINDEVVIIVIDSQWFLKDWDKDPKINDNCNIKTRSKFFEELEGLIKKSEGKTTLIAMHHPLFSNGSHGGQFSMKQQLQPFPVIGSLVSLFRKTGGVSPQDLQNKRYLQLRNRIITLAQHNSKVMVVSGHEHNLQYIKKHNLPQIISGSGAKITASRNIDGEFAYNNLGYAKVTVFKDGSSTVRFYGIENNTDQLVFQAEVISATTKKEEKTYNTQFPKFVKSAIYTDSETSKRKFYQKLWGKRYRKYFSKKINAPTVNLDTLFGGLTPKRKGGGHQSISLVLTTKEGKEYVMRAMRKSATKYLQAVAFKDQYIGQQFDSTATENLLLDVFTAAHPYVPFTIATLSDAINIYHTNPVLYYVPKQDALKGYNETYGDALYMIEERAASGHGDLASFGHANKVISTDDMLKKLRQGHKYSIDKPAYIRARLFDMVIGDWDRHEDQWRWAEFKNDDNTKFFRPIPRDRDQAYSKMGDGLLLGIASRIVPSLRLMQSYDDKLRSVKWFNLEPYPLDMALINGTDKSVWDEQVNLIKSNLTKAVIAKAFTHFPDEVNDKTIVEIQEKLIGRIANLQEISDAYYKQIHKNGIVTGTDKKDWFDIKRLPKGKTQVIGYKMQNKHKGDVFYEVTFNHNTTREILIYGLDGKDFFEVSGHGDQLIPIRIIGGQNNDTYDITNGRKVTIYDYKSKKNTFATHRGKHKLTDNYTINVYDYKNAKYSTNQLAPSIGSNKDDGLKIGLKNSYIINRFHSGEFTQKHTITANYYNETEGFELMYTGEFTKFLGSMALHFDAFYTSPNYSLNFFGFGNETLNFDDTLDEDFNRVKIKTLRFSPSLIRKGISGSSIQLSLDYEVLQVQNTSDRFIALTTIPDRVFENQNYISTDFTYRFENSDNKAFPTLGLKTSLQIGFKSNLDTHRSFSYLIPVVGFDYKLVPNGRLVLATKFKAHINFNSNFDFYHAASIGANDGLRGYRNQRFTGKNAYYQNIDLRYRFNKVKTALLPVNLGVFVGYDYGRVWLKNDPSKKWHNSFGGGLLMNMSDLMAFKIGAFSSDEDTLLSFGFNVGF